MTRNTAAPTDTAPSPPGPQLGLGANWAQFSLLVLVNAFVGAMVGVERTALPLLASETFGLASASLTLSFLVAFGLVKAFSNLAAGHGMTRYGRRPVLLAGWICIFLFCTYDPTPFTDWFMD